MRYTIYSDGACVVSRCLGGYAAIVQGELGRVIVHGGKKNATNNEMELLAIISALRVVSRNIRKSDTIEVYTDSSYIVNTINKGWYRYWIDNNWTTKNAGKPVKNKKLWAELLHYVGAYSIQFKWVKGHAGDEFNEMCDRYATDEVKHLKQITEAHHVERG